ncbi:flippase [bacterium]|nr:flippase [bacterium]
MPPSRVTSNSILILAAEVADRILRFVLVLVAARVLGDEDYGKFTFAIAFGSLFLIFADLGLHNLVVREIARARDDGSRLVGNGLVIKLVLSLLAFLSLFLVAQFTGKPKEVLLAIYIIAGALLVESVAEHFCAVFQGYQKLKYHATASFILSMSNAGLGIAVLFLDGGFVQLAWVYLFSRILKLIYALFVVHLRFTKVQLLFEPARMWYLVKEGWSFGVTKFFAMMYTYFDSTMLSLMVNDAVVGWYNVAYRLVFAMMVLPMGVMRAVYPALSAYHNKNEEAFKSLFVKTFKFMFIAGTSIATLVFVFSEKIIGLVFGAEYIEASKALKILVWSTAIFFVGTVISHAISAIGQQRFTAKVVAASAVLNLILNFILIPRYSFIGAAFATLASEVFTFTFNLWFVSRHVGSPPFFRLLPKVAVINLGMLLLLWLAVDFPLLVTLGLVIAVYAALILLTRFFSKEELLTIRSIVQFSRG